MEPTNGNHHKLLRQKDKLGRLRALKSAPLSSESHLILRSCSSYRPCNLPLLGGDETSTPRPASSTLASALTALGSITGAAVPSAVPSGPDGFISTYVSDLFRSSPHTTLQILLGTSLYVSHSVGLTPYHNLLFHPRLFWAPRYQLWRGVTGFAVTAFSLMDVVKSAVGMVYWQAPLERWFDGSGDVVRGAIVVRAGRNRSRKNASGGSGGGGRKSVLEWLLLDNKYIRAQALAAAVIIAIELILQRSTASYIPTSVANGTIDLSSLPSNITQHLPSAITSMFLFPYSLFPPLEHALRWLWALTAPTTTATTVLGVVPIKPVYLPLALCAMGGFSSWKDMLKGLVAALVVGKIMDVRRPRPVDSYVDSGAGSSYAAAGGGYDDNIADPLSQNVVDWFADTVASWVVWGKRQSVSVIGPAAPASTTATFTPPAASASIVQTVTGFFASSVTPPPPSSSQQQGYRTYRRHDNPRAAEEIRMSDLDSGYL
ncbi:uncharacterized protein EV422DRAFT_368907 [Fimicolochytrium jonesii]|uniref:uncharacterized protein n=1 Tax=Fimicolochytrium jonesii TaxID=1396493 RepID=UPI0022FF3139|nr:uncharacterized protein EV422DRAFT_368907 [Fimicolochytrium jonesii]KAI8823757.1 hypothetical protein EV422DRAFT_368907 [Fimicolochytrium jonesii]